MKGEKNKDLPQNQPIWKVSSTSLTYQRWSAMKLRVKELDSYKHAVICSEWLNDFDKFVEDMGECPKGYSLDRIDNNQGYNVNNCRWVLKADQNRNRRSCIMVGTLTLKEFAIKHNIPYGTIYHRVKKLGMSPQEAVAYKRWSKE